MQMEDIGATVIGSCLEPHAALLNHSCDPNAEIFFEGSELRVRSRRMIFEGEELTIAYVCPSESYFFRQNFLCSRFYFLCRCEKCQMGASRSTDMNTGNAVLDGSIQKLQASLRQLMHADPNTTPTGFFETEIVRICSQANLGGSVPSTIQPIPKLLHALAVYYQYMDITKSYACWLKLCFETDPLLWPSQYSSRRVENFMKYVGLEG